MNESFLAYIWKYRHLLQDIRTESGEQLVVIHPGVQNNDSGPDFFNARLRIGQTTWAGNVEIHVQASDWYRHGHQDDPAYDRTILHVVYLDDRPVVHKNGELIQTLVVRNKFPGWIYDRYQTMMQNQQWIPCGNQVSQVADNGFRMWAPALAVERLEIKTNGIKQLLMACENDWEETCYLHLAGNFGFRVNNMAFELLAKSLPLKIIRQHCDNPFRMEALLFGQAGMLKKKFTDQFPGKLQKEYQYLKSRHHLEPMDDGLWKFLRLRPFNFPTIRISQFASLLCLNKAGFFSLIEKGAPAGSSNLFEIGASDYWNTHYLFDKPAAYRKKIMGRTCGTLLVINGLAPFLFFYGLEKGQPWMCESVLELLEKTGRENNMVIDQWKKTGIPAENALQSQALLHLKQAYCDEKRCLECRIGSRLLR